MTESKAEELIEEFCKGKTPKDLIKEGENRKTVYKYYGIYNDMKEKIKSEEIVNKLILVLMEALRK